MYVPFCRYFWIPSTYLGIGHQCDNVASNILSYGGKGYDVQWRPKASFEYVLDTFNIKEGEFTNE